MKRRSTSIASLAVGAVSLITSQTVWSQISTADLVSYWKLDGDLTDAVGNNDGTFSAGEPVYVSGFDNATEGAVDFSGTEAWIETDLGVATTAKSLSLFFSIESDGTFDALAGVGAGQRFYLAYRGDAGGGFTNALGNGGGGQTFLPSAGYTPTGTDPALGSFHHLVLVDHGDGTGTSFYRSPSDSAHLQAAISFTGTAGGAGTLQIGTIDGATTLAADAIIDDVALFDRALTLTEVESIWEAGSVAAALEAEAPPLTIETTDPVNGSENVFGSTSLVATFNFPVQPGTGRIELYREDGSLLESLAPDDVTAPGTVIISGSEVTMTPSVPLQGGTGYYVLMEPGFLTNLEGEEFSGIDDPTVWAFTTASDEISLEDLVAYWKLDGTLRDEIGGNHAVLVDQDGGGDNTAFVAGFDGTPAGALNFAGTEDHLETPLETPVGPKSLSVFFTTTTFDDFQFLAGSHGGQRFYTAARGTGAVTTGVGNGGPGSTPLPSANFTPLGTDLTSDDRYHHLVLVDDGEGNATAYYRSPEDAQHLVYELPYQGVSGGAGFFGIGAEIPPPRASAELFASGRIDDVALFNKELNPSQIASIFEAGSVAAAAGGGRLVVTEVVLNRETDEVTLTWNSRPGQSFAVFYSGDLLDFNDNLGDGIAASEGETTSATFDLELSGLAGVPTLFFRVELE